MALSLPTVASTIREYSLRPISKSSNPPEDNTTFPLVESIINVLPYSGFACSMKVMVAPEGFERALCRTVPLRTVV